EHVGDDGAMVDDVEVAPKRQAAPARLPPPVIDILGLRAREFGLRRDHVLLDVEELVEAGLAEAQGNRALSGDRRTTLPGFMMSRGSSDCLTRRMTASTSPCSASRKSSFP